MENFILKIQNNIWYSIIMVFLAFFSIGLLSYELFYPGVTERGHFLARTTDLIIAYIFLADFFAGLIFTKGLKGRGVYLKNNWLNLASSIPITNDFARTFRLLRVFRALRIIRAFMNLEFAEQRRKTVNKNHK